METKKQEAIRLAYGEYWEKVKDLVDENGWIFHEKGFYQKYQKMVSPFEIGFTKDNEDNLDLHPDTYKKTANFYWRPKSLFGLENNLGWTSILSEEDLPKEYNEYKVGKRYNGKFYLSRGEYDKHEVKASYIEDKITHYQPIIKPQPPIF